MAYDGPFFMGPEGPMMPEFNLGPASQQKVSGLPEIEDVDDEVILCWRAAMSERYIL